MDQPTDMAPRVEIYTTPTCGSCVRAKRLLATFGIIPHEIDVSHDRSQMQQRAGHSTVPQIFINDTRVGGYEDLVAMMRNGTLLPALGMT